VNDRPGGARHGQLRKRSYSRVSLWTDGTRVKRRHFPGMYLGPRQAKTYAERLAQAHWRQRRQCSSKVRRHWPGRQDHKPPEPPKILKMGTILKDKMEKTLAMAQACIC
jgi:hypothetical protein